MNDVRMQTLERMAERAALNGVTPFDLHMKMSAFFVNDEIAYALNHYREAINFLSEVSEHE